MFGEHAVDDELLATVVLDDAAGCAAFALGARQIRARTGLDVVVQRTRSQVTDLPRVDLRSAATALVLATLLALAFVVFLSAPMVA